MDDPDLKAENAALRKQNKHLKALLEEALEIIRKLKEFVARSSLDSAPLKRKAGAKRKSTKTAKAARKLS